MTPATAGRTPREVPACLANPIAEAHSTLTDALRGWTARGLARGLAHQLEGGKGLRPALSIWWGGHLGVSREAARSWGLAVELLHNAFLIHDDIEDGDRWRRGRPTLWVEAGVPVALNVADHLLAEAYRTLGELDAPAEEIVTLLRDFSETHRTTVEGQALDLEFRGDPSFTLTDYEQIIRQKTGRYLALTWVGPSRLAGWNSEAIEILWRLGDELGPAFQIRDDVLDLTAGKGRGGEIGCDIREGKPSILVAHALQTLAVTDTRREELVATLAKSREKTTPDEVERVIAWFDELGSIEFANAEAQRRTEAARALFQQLPDATAERTTEFEEVAAFLVDRKA